MTGGPLVAKGRGDLWGIGGAAYRREGVVDTEGEGQGLAVRGLPELRLEMPV